MKLKYKVNPFETINRYTPNYKVVVHKTIRGFCSEYHTREQLRINYKLIDHSTNFSNKYLGFRIYWELD